MGGISGNSFGSHMKVSDVRLLRAMEDKRLLSDIDHVLSNARQKNSL
jgi:hypothetical protein